MKNSLRVLTASPVVILGILSSLSMPVRAQGIPGAPVGAPVGAPSLPDVPNVPSVDDLAPGSESVTPEAPAETSVEAEAPVEAPAEEPTATEVTPTEEPTATEVAPTEEPTATEVTPTEAPTATEVTPTEDPTATEVAPTEEPTASEEAVETAPTANTEGTDSAQTIVDIASSDQSFSTLVTAIEAAGLTESLMADGAFTVFAPTNAAFEALPPGVLEKLLQPENKQVLAKVLTHHVLSDERMASDLSTEAVTSLANSSLQIKVDEAGVGIDNAKVVQADIDASNGVIHVIDQVLIPQELLQAPAPSSN